jgi:hypothetical protein
LRAKGGVHWLEGSSGHEDLWRCDARAKRKAGKAPGAAPFSAVLDARWGRRGACYSVCSEAAPRSFDRTHEDCNANAFGFFFEELLILTVAHQYTAIFWSLRAGISDENFYARVRSGAPCDGVPDVAAAEAEEIAEAYMRYSFLIGIAEPCDDIGRAAMMKDVLAHPDLADCGSFVYEDAERLMGQWSGAGRQSVRAYLYEELVYTAACGLMLCPGDKDPDEEYCHDVIVMHHARWFKPSGL